VRGTGFYLTHLRDALLEYYPKNIYHFFSQEEQLPNKLDLIHYPYFEPFFLTLPLWKQYKTIVTVHDLTPLVFPKDFPIGLRGWLKWQIQKKSLKNCDAIITDSYASKKDIEKLCHIEPEKIHVVYLAAGEQFQQIETKEFEEVRKKYNLPASFALYVGDATANKNLPRLVQACIHTNIPLVMVGKSLSDTTVDRMNGWNKDLVKIQALAQENPLIHIIGFVSNQDLVALYNAATLFVMPSLYEGFGLPVLEAMASGCPVICSKDGSLAEVAGDAAYFIDPYDVQNIAKGISALYKDKAKQKKLSQKGLLHIKNFSWEKTARQTVAIYSSLV
jgi:glycosyltransferase involved in cell wall biosynthesis